MLFRSALASWLVVFALAQRSVAWTLVDRRFVKLPLKAQWALAAVAIYLILAYAGAKVDFIYFNF